MTDTNPTPENPTLDRSKGGNPNLTPGALEARIAQDARCLQLRIAGLTLAQIATQLRIGKTTAIEAVQRALQGESARLADMRDEYRTLHINRLEATAQVYYASIIQQRYRDVQVLDAYGQPKLDPAGDPIIERVRLIDHSSIQGLVKVLEREAKLLGLDAPVRINVTDDTSTAIGDMIADLERMLGDPDVIEATGHELSPDVSTG